MEEEVPMNKNEAINQLINHMHQVQVEQAVDYLGRLSETHSLDRTLEEVLEPFLQTVGERWMNNEDTSLSDAYIASKIAAEFLKPLAEDRSEKNHDKVALIGNIKNDYHSSGRKLVVQFLESDGWRVVDLGNDVDPKTFVSVAKEEKIRFIAVSSMLYENALEIRNLSRMIEDNYLEGERPYLIAGGAIFNVVPGLKEELGIHYSAPNAYAAKQLFNKLYEEAM